MSTLDSMTGLCDNFPRLVFRWNDWIETCGIALATLLIRQTATAGIEVSQIHGSGDGSFRPPENSHFSALTSHNGHYRTLRVVVFCSEVLWLIVSHGGGITT
jgi:hypothetical protein